MYSVDDSFLFSLWKLDCLHIPCQLKDEVNHLKYSEPKWGWPKGKRRRQWSSCVYGKKTFSNAIASFWLFGFRKSKKQRGPFAFVIFSFRVTFWLCYRSEVL